MCFAIPGPSLGHGRGTPQHRDIASLPSPTSSHLLSHQAHAPGAAQAPGTPHLHVSSTPRPVPASLLQHWLWDSHFTFLAQVPAVPGSSRIWQMSHSCLHRAGAAQHPPVPSCWHQLGGAMSLRGQEHGAQPGAQNPCPPRLLLPRGWLEKRGGGWSPAGHLCSPALLALQSRARRGCSPCHPLNCDKGSSRALRPSSDMQDLPGGSVDPTISVFVMLNSTSKTRGALQPAAGSPCQYWLGSRSSR